MVLSNQEKAENERILQKTMIGRLESKIANHTSTPLSEIEVDLYLGQVLTYRDEAIVNQRNLMACPAVILPTAEQEFRVILDRLDSAQVGLQNIKIAFPPPSTGSGAIPGGSGSSGSGPTDIRLPRLELPTFTGNLTEWMSFHDMFVSTVHLNGKLSNAQKMTYLRSVITGEAASLIKAIPATDANYNVAWNLLLDRFQNERELFFSILQRFTDQAAVQDESATALRSLIDVSKECMRSLEALKVQINQWDGILVFHMVQKLDTTSRQFWELSLKDKTIPQLSSFMEFLEQRARALAAGELCKSNLKPSLSENLTSSPSRNIQNKPRSDSSSPRISRSHHVGVQSPCKICTGDHTHNHCPMFLALGVPERQELVRKHLLCFNCLRHGHGSSKCSSPNLCHTCKAKHHTLIHFEKGTNPATSAEPVVVTHHSNDDTRINQALLATAIVKVTDKSGQHQFCRALLDGGSTSSFITEALVQKLGLRRRHTNANVYGLSASQVGIAKGILTVIVSPHNGDQVAYEVKTLILPKITGQLPAYVCDPSVWPHLQGLELADPAYHKPAGIDLLLGADVFWNLLLDGKKTGPPSSPVGLRSTLGWLIAGNLDTISSHIMVHIADTDLDARLKTFWELESIPTTSHFTQEEKRCEEHFDATHQRRGDGRFVVKLPFKKPPVHIGESRDIAIRRLKQLERRLGSHPVHCEEYVKFMDEYESLGHMAPVPIPAKPSPRQYFIPHHFVEKLSSSTTKFRVVFDASAKSSNGKSLNDALMVGPTIQDNLINILMRFRTHAIGFTADIAKMYRQINIDQEDMPMQRIVWRRNPSHPIQEFQLLTVTYGTASAPYLATKVLQQLAQNEKESLPLASKIVLSDLYVDDVMSGSSTTEEALRTTPQLIELMKRGGFQLRKWSSNSTALLESLSPELRENQGPLQIDTDDVVKTLGLSWNPGLDEFVFKVTICSYELGMPTTKRQLLSEMSKVFDPLGWLSPCTIRAKILFQRLWKLNIGWDDNLPNFIQHEWNTYKANLPQIERIRIKRCIIPTGATRITLHGFSDASEQAYAAAAYVRAEMSTTSPVISLIAAKTRVAPAKQVTLPRLELCGAVLLSELMTNINQALHVKFDGTFAHTDSTVVLDWIQAPPSRWKTFVANRVSEIQQQLPASHWHHVSGKDNPADCASRGLDPSELEEHPLWWTGAPFLQYSDICTGSQHVTADPELVMKEQKQSIFVGQVQATQQDSFLHRCSTLKKLVTITAWGLRYISNRRNPTYKPRTRQQILPLSPKELDRALKHWIRYAQSEVFKAEIQCIANGKAISTKSRVLTLNPFLDSEQLLRVGGRLRHSELPSEQKTPILLPRHHRLTQLLIVQEHLDNFHAGPQLLLSLLQSRYWIVGARDAIRHQLRRCFVCIRQKASTSQQFMGDLPSSRVTPARAFLRCGVDYAGPFVLRAIPARSKVTFKAYMALFICLTTRAIHIEIVSSLSTDAFIAALKRFTARRGKSSDLYSDQGTNFIGASRELKDLYMLVNGSNHNNIVTSHLAKQGIQWHFNPPGAPHFGGLWEAGVKSVKYHLHRVLGTTRLTYEELSTTMTQIEACLNSRPLTPISSDPGDLQALTPGHFLIGSPLLAIPEIDLTSIPTGRLNRWQLTQQLQQQFWQRWSKEFLTRLQQRPKWLQHRQEIKVDDLVIIKQDNLPPLHWQLGRVIKVHPGKDNIVRVVTLKTQKGELQRPIVKLCLLPLDSACKLPDHNDNM